MIAIWGANGFIGRHLIYRLKASGEGMKLFARDFEGFPFPFPSEVQSFNYDFSRPADYMEQMRDCHAAILLVNAAAPENISVAYKNFFDALEGREGALKRIIYISSGGAIYGVTERKPIDESYPLNPVSAYGRSKKDIEQTVIAAAQGAPWDYSILRVANPVGRWNKKSNLVDAALDSARTGQPLAIWGDGSAVRDYFDAGELAQAIALTIEKPQAANSIFNVGSGAGHSVNDVLKLVEAAASRPIPVQCQLPRPTDVPYNVLDCGLIQTKLGWKAQKPLGDIIKGMVVSE